MLTFNKSVMKMKKSEIILLSAMLFIFVAPVTFGFFTNPMPDVEVPEGCTIELLEGRWVVKSPAIFASSYHIEYCGNVYATEWSYRIDTPNGYHVREKEVGFWDWSTTVWQTWSHYQLEDYAYDPEWDWFQISVGLHHGQPIDEPMKFQYRNYYSSNTYLGEVTFAEVGYEIVTTLGMSEINGLTSRGVRVLCYDSWGYPDFFKSYYTISDANIMFCYYL